MESFSLGGSAPLSRFFQSMVLLVQPSTLDVPDGLNVERARRLEGLATSRNANAHPARGIGGPAETDFVPGPRMGIELRDRCPNADRPCPLDVELIPCAALQIAGLEVG